MKILPTTFKLALKTWITYITCHTKLSSKFNVCYVIRSSSISLVVTPGHSSSIRQASPWWLRRVTAPQFVKYLPGGYAGSQRLNSSSISLVVTPGHSASIRQVSPWWLRRVTAPQFVKYLPGGYAGSQRLHVPIFWLITLPTLVTALRLVYQRYWYVLSCLLESACKISLAAPRNM